MVAEKRISEFQANRFVSQCRQFWDKFYLRNSINFFKDRQWTDREFPELRFEDNSVSKRTLLEVGCGVGNFVYPMLEKNPTLYFYACDFSIRAVEHVQNHPSYSSGRCTAFVCDISQDELCQTIKEPVDLISMIFVLSAIIPQNMDFVLQNLSAVLKTGGVVMFRDYAQSDHAQKRFEESKDPKCIDDNLYVRQDGTLSYFFQQQKLRELFARNGFMTLECEYIERETVNRKENICVKRIFLQARFQKC